MGLIYGLLVWIILGCLSFAMATRSESPRVRLEYDPNMEKRVFKWMVFLGNWHATYTKQQKPICQK